MFRWRNSSTNGLPIMKMTRCGSLIKTRTYPDTIQLHEKYVEGVRYYVRYPKTHSRFLKWQKHVRKQEEKNQVSGMKAACKTKGAERPIIVRDDSRGVVEDVTHIVRNDGWCFDIDEPLDPVNGRMISERFGMMIMQIAQKISNHSYFRNYPLELKQDCQSYSYEKIIRGLFNFSFRFTNVFAYISQACFNSFKSILAKHYKQVNIKRAMTKRAMVNLEADLPGSSMRKSLGNQFEGNDYDGFTEF